MQDTERRSTLLGHRHEPDGWEYRAAGRLFKRGHCAVAHGAGRWIAKVGATTPVLVCLSVGMGGDH